jgi:hypothetical protein
MKTKLCRRCGTVKDRETEFYVYSGKYKRVSAYCKECTSRLATEISNRRLHNNMEKIVAYLQSNPCIDCGEEDWQVLEFDHVEPSTKLESVSYLARRRPWEIVKAEIEKCEVRCANCHRRRTAHVNNHHAYIHCAQVRLH